MSLYSGYNANFDYGNGYTPQANTAYNNTMANAAANQAAVSRASQAYDPFASTGGFGRQTADYAALGAAYGRATGGFAGPSDPIQGPIVGGDPAFSDPAYSEPVYGHPDAGYTPATESQIGTFGAGAREYADQHHLQYGYYPSNDYFSGHFNPQTPSASDQYVAPPAQPFPDPNQRYNPIGEVYGHPEQAGYTPATQSQIDTFGAGAREYADQHHLQYGYNPTADYFSSGNFQRDYGSAFSNGAGTPQAPSASDQYKAPPASWDTLNPTQSQYVMQHIDRYGYEPSSDFFEPGGGWDQNYGPSASLNGGASFDDRYSAAPPIQPGLQPLPGDYPAAIGAGLDPSNKPPNTSTSFDGRFSGAPGYDPAAGAMPNNTPADFPGWTPPQPDASINRAGYNSPLNPTQNAYIDQHVQQYGYGPTGDFFDPGKGWDQNYGRNAMAGALMANGSDPSYLDAGQPGSDYNPFGSINSGQIGSSDAFGGYQPPASLNDRIGNIPGQPYGPGYFDNTFGSVNAQQGQQGPIYNPTAGGGYPGPMASDGEAQRQQMIQDLYKTLGIIDNAGESGRYQDRPYGDTLQQGDVFTSPGGG
jgi:hypothetical protein